MQRNKSLGCSPELYFFKFVFNQRTVALQCCVGSELLFFFLRLKNLCRWYLNPFFQIKNQKPLPESNLHHPPDISPDVNLGSHCQVNCTKGGLFFSESPGNHTFEIGAEKQGDTDSVPPEHSSQVCRNKSHHVPIFSFFLKK